MPLLEVSGYAAGPPSAVVHPLTGRPWADVTLGTTRVPWAAGDHVTMNDERGTEYRMTVERVGPRGGFITARLVCGTGGLSLDVKEKYYRDIPAVTVVREIIEDAGEQVGDLDLPGTLPTWTRPRGPAHEALRAVMMRYPAHVWRMDPDGTVNVGVPEWPEHETPVRVESEDAATGLYTCEYTPTLQAGQHVTLTRGDEEIGKRVTRVQHTLTEVYDYPRPRVQVRTVVTASDGRDPGQDSLDALVQRATRWTDYTALYPCEVLRDHGDHTLDLRPEHPLMPELTRVRLIQPIAGAKVKIKAGAVVLLGFQAGDPARPVVLEYAAVALEKFEMVTGRGQGIVIDDDRGQASPENREYVRPHIRVVDAAGQQIELHAEKGRERVRVRDKAGQVIEMLPGTGTITVQANTHVNVKAGTTATVQAAVSATVDAATVNIGPGGNVVLAGGGPPVARVGDAVDPYTHLIISGSPRVVSG